MFYVQRLKKHSFVELGKFVNESDAVAFIARTSFIEREVCGVFRCEDGHTYRVIYK